MTVKPRDYVYGIIIFSIMLVGGVGLLSELAKETPSFTNDDQFGIFNTTSNLLFKDVNKSMNDLNSSITGSTANPGVFGFLDSLVNTGWNSLKLLGETFGFADKAYHSILDSFGVPDWLVTGILLLILVMIAFSVLSAVFQKDV